MRSLGVALVVLLGLTATALADEPREASPVPPDALEDAAKKARFTSYVIDGDRARAAGRATAAARAYAAALDVRHDPLIAGRLGVLLVQLGKPVDAADLLLDAIQRATNATAEERQGFLKAYDAARAEMTWVDVTISHAGTKLTLDGEPRNRDGFSALSMFVAPGEHELRARLDGYEDAVETFTARKGQEMRVTLTLRALPEPLPPPLKLRRENPRRPDLSSLDEPPEDEPPSREPIVGGVTGEQKKAGLRGSVSGGPIVVFGVASWSPAVGAMIAGSLRPNDYVSLGLEARAAWLTSGVEGGQINAMTVGGLASVCGHWRWLFGCALGHVGLIRIQGAATSYKGEHPEFVKLGIGGRIGAKFNLTQSFSMQASVDAVALDSGTKIIAGQTAIVDQPPVLVGAQVAGGWEF
ncbi:PEGA domain-containing protein [Polyangium sp. 15x6]|uniref:PEGA domain-containing protein n=1 Tax=Polyangium sp. 15x6 TaxID=3042687 RepID=UPI00249ADE14|nr:PEGA domain-containing protein [Polyangium sp. 15x6]MDI3284801.1 PEGA domain-containing protein [Polyangium sp. 15x6]